MPLSAVRRLVSAAAARARLVPAAAPRRSFSAAALLAAAFGASAPAPVYAETVVIFAAASTRAALEEIAPAFAAASGHELVVSPAGSSALARQIQQGAPAHLFLSANVAWMDALEADGLIAPGGRADLLGNALVLIAHGRVRQTAIGPDLDLSGLLQGGRLAMALVDAVPAGIYGKAALTSLGLWRTAAPRVAQTDNVRAALALVAAGEAPLGVVYATDAAAEPAVSVIGRFPADSHPPIVYPVAIVAERDGAPARALLAFLQGPAARAVFERQGFRVLATPAAPPGGG